jgi:hypothetical protein
MKKLFLLAPLLLGCASSDKALVTQLLEDIQNQKQQNILLVQQAQGAINECEKRVKKGDKK